MTKMNLPEPLLATPDVDGTMLDTVVLHGSPMGDSNQHDHTRVPGALSL